MGLAAARPFANPGGPVVELRVGIAAGVHALGAVKAEVHEVGGGLLDEGIATGGAGDAAFADYFWTFGLSRRF